MRELTNAKATTDSFLVETGRTSQPTRPPCPTSAEVIPALVERIVREFEPVQIILFGSQARGQARWDSDVDLLVVLPAAPDKHKAAVAIRRALRDVPVAKDIIVSTPDEIARYGDMVGRILRAALREGTVRCYMQETDAHLEETRLWLRYAQGDLRAAEAAVRQPEFEPRHACFQAQQAAEKALKAVLVFLRRDVPRIHDLDALIDALPQDWPVAQEYPDLANLTDWAVNARYPLAGQEPTHEDAEEAVRQARAVLESVQHDLIAHGFTWDAG